MSNCLADQSKEEKRIKRYFASYLSPAQLADQSPVQSPAQSVVQSTVQSLASDRLDNLPTTRSVMRSFSKGRTSYSRCLQDDWSRRPSGKPMSPDFSYKVGGSLAAGDSSYVVRQADLDLIAAVRQRQFAYVLGPRQMGKSSLRVHAREQLESVGNRCATIQANQLIDRTHTGTSCQIQANRLMITLWDGLQPKVSAAGHKGRLTTLSDTADRPVAARLRHFSRTVLEPLLQQGPLVIFIDEVDALLNTSFAVELFRWIEQCYQYRIEHEGSTICRLYQNLNFVVLGSVLATDLPVSRTLLAAGRQIEIEPFKLSEATPLKQGFAGKIAPPAALLNAIFDWTQGQPFLTQKVCYVLQTLIRQLVQTSDKPLVLSPETIQHWVDETVRSQIIKDWPNQDEPVHLRAISDRIARSPNKTALKALYKRIYAGTPVTFDHSYTQLELLLSGIVVSRYNQLQIANEIYRHVFPLR